VTMMDAALNTQKPISRLYLCIGFVRMAPAPARQGVIVTARESIRYITGWYNNSTTDVEQIRNGGRM